MFAIARAYQQCSALSRLMLIASFGFNLGFYMVLPYLAYYLLGDLLLSATAVGAILGVRAFSQQGLFIVGGALADRIGGRALLLWGGWLRASGFALFALGSHPTLLLAAAFVTGVAGALFTPAAQAYFARQSCLPRTDMFALLATARNTGELLGPPLGFLLLQVHFSWLCLLAALPFAAFALLLPHFYPRHNITAASPIPPDWKDWRNIFANGPFLRFSLAMMGYFVLINQLAFALPLALHSHSHNGFLLGAIFTLAALSGLLLQYPLSQWLTRRGKHDQALRWGLLLMGGAFLIMTPLAIQPTWAPFFGISCALLFTLGTLLVYPTMMNRVSQLAPPAQQASYFGVFYFFAGLAMLAGNVLVAISMHGDQPTLTWLWLSAIAIVSAAINPGRRAAESSFTPLSSAKRPTP